MRGCQFLFNLCLNCVQILFKKVSKQNFNEKISCQFGPADTWVSAAHRAPRARPAMAPTTQGRSSPWPKEDDTHDKQKQTHRMPSRHGHKEPTFWCRPHKRHRMGRELVSREITGFKQAKKHTTNFCKTSQQHVVDNWIMETSQDQHGNKRKMFNFCSNLVWNWGLMGDC